MQTLKLLWSEIPFPFRIYLAGLITLGLLSGIWQDGTFPILLVCWAALCPGWAACEFWHSLNPTGPNLSSTQFGPQDAA